MLFLDNFGFQGQIRSNINMQVLLHIYTQKSENNHKKHIIALLARVTDIMES